ncbi:MAG: hypothetical protein F4Z57_13815 [Gemmatimonadetes bacterium]|nr:hypothetical protein [Gemmatimonadota bacterium]
MLSVLCAATVLAEEFRFDSAASWSTWKRPHGLIEFDDRGRLQLVKFRKDINAVADASNFTHLTRSRGANVPGGIWEAGSNPATARRIIDGDRETFWQASADDPLGDWFVQIDLGRTVLAKEIRLHFPDQEGARPFRQFTVFTATGITSDALDDLFIFRPVYLTTQPNRDTTVSFPLAFDLQDSAQVLDPNRDVDLEKFNQYRLIQYINFTVEDFDPEGALAEIEVIAVGDNVSLGNNLRGGIIDGLTARSTENILDGDMNTASSILPVGFEGRVRTWEDQGTWFFIDLGAVFWLDELFLYALRPREGTVGSVAGAPRGFNFLYSDGTRVISSQLPIPESFDFATLIDQPDPNPMRYLRYLLQPRRVRYLFWHAHIPQGWGSRWTELMLFSPGHPAEIIMRSDFIDLGAAAGDGRPKVISSLSWDADIPPGTRLQVRSRSGNTQGEVYAFHDKIGELVTEEKWLSLPKVLRGRIDTTVVVSEDWDSWSEAYNFSGEAFKSQSPRRFVQLELILSTDDPQVAPAIDALSLEYEDALLQGARGLITPRVAQPNEDTRFTYTLVSAADDEDAGFDLLRFDLPSKASNVEVRAGGIHVEPSSIAIRADTLQIGLPRAITADSVQVSFTTRVVHNATLFGLDLGSSSHPDLWQSVEPLTRRANIVMLPDLTGTTRLIDDLSISSSVLTPNGDGINDEVVIRFVAFKVEQHTPRVRIFDLAGRSVAELATPTIDGLAHVFTWNGRATQGNLVPPGTYLCHIDLGADAGDDTALHTIAVAY